MIKFKQKGDFSKLSKYLYKLSKTSSKKILIKYAEKGIDALKAATPIDTGKTSNSWYYEITSEKGIYKISFLNKNIQNGVPIALILQYGHGTKNGGWVEGRDYINPTIQPIFDEIVKDAWKEVTMK